jgi:hypothetical protein
MRAFWAGLAIRGMDAPAFSAFPEAQLQEKQGKWELPQTTFAEA